MPMTTIFTTHVNSFRATPTQLGIDRDVADAAHYTAIHFRHFSLAPPAI